MDGKRETHMSAIETLKAKVREQETQVIFECVLQLAVVKTSDERMTRAALIEVYEERTSEAEADALMDLIGM